jgi:hypothetical protein
MPYITPNNRTAANTNPAYGKGNPGILAYRLTQAVIAWLPKDYRFADLDAAIGALEATKQEFYRRVVAPYEDSALAKNSDVYPNWLLPNIISDETD